MKIIIVGCGKIGKSVAKELVKENHDLVVIDDNGEVVDELSNSIDVLGVVGNGASIDVLREAGVESADLLLAVTSKDEVNMLCCLFTKKANPNCRTIARVRNPLYSEQINIIRDDLGLSMTINPELITAREISRLIRWPKALQVDSFNKGRVELISFLANKNIVGKSIREIMSIYKSNILFVGVERNEEAIIPNGSTLIEENDKVSIVGTPFNASSFLSKIGIYQSPIKSCMLVGGSRIAYYLASSLAKYDIKVQIIEKEKERCVQLADSLPDVSIVHGLANDENLLLEEGLRDVDCFCSLTGVDEENIFLSLYAKKHSQATIVTKVNHIGFDEVVDSLEVGAIVSPKSITATNIVTYVRALANAGGNDIETMHRLLHNLAEAISFRIKEKSGVVGIPFENLPIKDNTLICSIIRNNEVITPTGKSTIELGDTVLVVTTNTGLVRIEDIIK